MLSEQVMVENPIDQTKLKTLTEATKQLQKKWAKDKSLLSLKKLIQIYDTLYYKFNAPVVSDTEYDYLKKELEALEAHLPESKRTSSPTQAIGDDRLEAFEQYRHREPMMSLDNTYNKEELFAFDERLHNFFREDKLDYLVEPKIDGVAVSITYENGQLIRAVTRGNGVEGDVITHNAKTIKHLPQILKGKDHPKVIEIRGEIYMTYEAFEAINLEREEAGLTPYANPRNLAAGTVKLLDPEATKKRSLRIICYGMGYCEPKNTFRDLSTLHRQFKAWGLPTQEKTWHVQGIDAAWGTIEQLDALRHTFSYATDGAVIKLNAFSQQAEAGYTAKAPRWAISYKFAPEQAETILKTITIQVGRTGVLTPVAELEPVQLSGTTVSRATLHNADEIARKDIRTGDTVLVEKAGEIIPCVLGVNLKKRPTSSKPYTFPRECPECGESVVHIEGEVAWRCPNVACPPQVRRRITHFTSRVAMNIDHLGSAIVDQLVSQGLVENFADLYTLTLKDLLKLERFKAKSAQNLIDALQVSKHNELWRLIHGLGILNVGAQSAKDLARHFKSVDALMHAQEEDLLAVEGIGPTVARCILDYFSHPPHKHIIEKLKKYQLNLRLEDTEDTPQVLKGKTCVLTGTLPTLTREEAKAMVERAGGKAASTVSKKTDYVIAGEAPGSKYDKAQALGIKILDEEGFLDLFK